MVLDTRCNGNLALSHLFLIVSDGILLVGLLLGCSYRCIPANCCHARGKRRSADFLSRIRIVR